MPSLWTTFTGKVACVDCVLKTNILDSIKILTTDSTGVIRNEIFDFFAEIPAKSHSGASLNYGRTVHRSRQIYPA